MAVVINGSGTVTGLSVGGLPDGTVDAGTLADDAVGLAQMASGTDGNLITYDASGNPAAVAVGTSGQVLVSNGAGAAPTFAGGGIIIHEHSVSNTTKYITNNITTWVDSGLTKTITPHSANSYFYAEVYHNEHIILGSPNYGGGMRILGGSTEIVRGGQMYNKTGVLSPYFYNGDAKTWGSFYNPNTASSITFKVQVTGTSNGNGDNYYYWHWHSNYIANMFAPRLRIIEFK